MSDLLKRLRDRYSNHSQELRDEAADCIEALEISAIHEKWKSAMARIEALESVLNQVRGDLLRQNVGLVRSAASAVARIDKILPPINPEV